MSIICITASIYVDTEGRDPEDVCGTMARGLDTALSNFPDGIVIQADVENGRPLSPDEIVDHGFEE